MQSKNKKIRILHLPTTTGGNPQNLAKSERKLGLSSWAMSLNQNYLNYTSDEVLCRKDSRIWCELKRLLFYRRLFSQYDIIHYNAGSLLAPMTSPPDRVAFFNIKNIIRWVYCRYSRVLRVFELKMLTLLGKKIFVTYQGDDARQGDYCRANFTITFASEVEDGYYSEASDKEKRRNISLLDKYAYKIYSVNPDLLYVLPERTEFVPYAHLDLSDWNPVYLDSSNRKRKLKIIHAPSHQGVKGTRFVVDAIDKLYQKGYEFEFELIEGLSNDNARKRYEGADLLIDQLFAGWYGGLAVELMALGKPVICYIREQDLHFIPKEMQDDLPIIRATTDSLLKVLEEWIVAERSVLASQGRLSRIYVEKWHFPLAIANRIKQDYEDAINGMSQQE